MNLEKPKLAMSLRTAVILCACWVFFPSAGHSQINLAQPTGRVSTSTANIPSLADGSLRDCCAATVDRAWAVGDRGLILATENGGRSWSVQHNRLQSILYAVDFIDESRGWAVGGEVEPMTIRSRAVILQTSDGGQTWRESMPLGMPRLIGLQIIGHEHLLAWGDWSDAMQSSLFESIDGGETWSARPVPCGHLQCAASDSAGRVVVVDRNGRVFLSADGLEYQPVVIPGQIANQISFCRRSETGWWLGGEGGRLYRSIDGKSWVQVRLPGTNDDHELFSLRDMTSNGASLWIVGQPGNVVWHSGDDGATWQTQSTRQSLPLNAIAAANSQVLFACGPMAMILGTRNNGTAWWSQHQSGSRTCILSMATTMESVPWDLLTYATHEARRHASLVVMHDQFVELRLSNRAELDSRVGLIASKLHVASAKVWPQYLVGNLYAGYRAGDLAYYPNSGGVQSTRNNTGVSTPVIVRRIIAELRSLRPDVVVTDGALTGDALQSSSAVAVDTAIHLAGSKDFALFSASSGIENAAWATSRTLVREHRAGGLSYPPAMVLQNSGTVMEDALTKARELLEGLECESLRRTREYTYRLPQQRHAPLSQPLEGVILDAETMLAEKVPSQKRLNELIQSSQLLDGIAELVKQPGNAFIVDNAWNDRLKALCKNARREVLMPTLLSAAGQARRAGYWNRWHSILEQVIAAERDSVYTEAAFSELMRYQGSVEVQCLIDQHLEQSTAPGSDLVDGTDRSAWQQSSPFARTVSVEAPVQRASFQSTLKMVPVVRNRGTEEFVRLLTKWPDTWQVQRTDPNWAWLLSSRYRATELAKGNDLPQLQRQQAVYWPAHSTTLASWGNVAREEKLLLDYWVSPKQSSGPNQWNTNKGIAKIPFTTSRPFLDGKADEGFWKNATVIQLNDPWLTPPMNGPQSAPSTLRIARDDEFLYIYCQCNQVASVEVKTKDSQNETSRKATSKADSSTGRRRDSVQSTSDHVRLRLDIDRDYATWHEFSWNINGDTQDQCCDMLNWDPPAWFIANEKNDRIWASEIAIPLKTLVPASKQMVDQRSVGDVNGKGSESSRQSERGALDRIDWTEQVWGISVVRSVPGATAQTMPTMTSDRLSPDQWQLVDPSK